MYCRKKHTIKRAAAKRFRFAAAPLIITGTILFATYYAVVMRMLPYRNCTKLMCGENACTVSVRDMSEGAAFSFRIYLCMHRVPK